MFIKFTPNAEFQRTHKVGAGPFDGIEVPGGFEVSLPERLDDNGWPVCPVVIVTKSDGSIDAVKA
jgi:hypothetical protein